MFYSIRHVTRYRYDAPVRESVMQLYMQPKSEGAQRLQSFQVATHPRAGLQAYTDHFGNAVYHFDVPGVHQELTVEADAEVETQAMPAPPEWVDASAWSALEHAAGARASISTCCDQHGLAHADAGARRRFLPSASSRRATIR